MVQLVTAGGTVLEQGFFNRRTFTNPQDGTVTESAAFMLSLPWHAEVHAVEIGVHTDGALSYLWKRHTFSANPPVATLTGPPPGTLAASFEVTWQAEDADGDRLSSTLLISPDDGATWEIVAMDIPHDGHGAFSHTLDADAYPAGGQYRFRVVVSDGLRSAEATTAALYALDGSSAGPRLELPRSTIVASSTR